MLGDSWKETGAVNFSIRTWISLVLVLFAFSACCSEECLSDVTIEFDPHVMEAGAYRIEITTDEIQQVCEATLPLPDGEIPYCDDHEPGFGDFVLDADRAGFSGFRLGSGPDAIEVRLSRDDVLIGSATLRPEYTIRESSCGCRTGTTVLSIQ